MTERKIKYLSLKQDSVICDIRALWAFCVNSPQGNKINFLFQAKSRLCWDPCNGRDCAWRAARWGFCLWGFSKACISYSYLCHLPLWNSPLFPNSISVLLLLLLYLDTEYEAMPRCTISSISPERAAPAMWVVFSLRSPVRAERRTTLSLLPSASVRGKVKPCLWDCRELLGQVQSSEHN